MIADKQYLPIQQETESVNTNSICRQVLSSLEMSEEYRHSFVEECIRSRLTTQIRTMREHRDSPWDYKTFADKLGKKVSWTYRLEDPNASTPTIPTLLEVARAFDVALDVRFIPFSKLLHDTTTLTPDSFGVPSFNDELPEMERRAGADVTDAQTAAGTALLLLPGEKTYPGSNPLEQPGSGSASELYRNFGSSGSNSFGNALLAIKPPTDIGMYRASKIPPTSATFEGIRYDAERTA